MPTANNPHREALPAPPNVPPGTSRTAKAVFLARTLADLQVASVILHLKPWLRTLSGRILEIGCGAQPYRHWVPSNCSYQGLDSETAKTHFGYLAPDTLYYDGDTFPFPDGIFDALFHTEVIEHVYAVHTFLRECRRVLKPGSQMFFSVPFQARYHYIPHDFWRFTPAALEKLLLEAGFAEISIAPRGTDITVAAYKSLSIVYRWLQGDLLGKLLGLIASPAAVLFLIVGHFSLRLAVGSTDDCLGYSVTARKGRLPTAGPGHRRAGTSAPITRAKNASETGASATR
jgi:SAM-dependent methyltransferase